LKDGFQQHWRCRSQRRQYTLLVICQAVIPMCPGVLLERTAEPQERLYDLVRAVVR